MAGFAWNAKRICREVQINCGKEHILFHMEQISKQHPSASRSLTISCWLATSFRLPVPCAGAVFIHWACLPFQQRYLLCVHESWQVEQCQFSVPIAGVQMSIVSVIFHGTKHNEADILKCSNVHKHPKSIQRHPKAHMSIVVVMPQGTKLHATPHECQS